MSNVISFDGPDEIAIFRAIVISNALKLYASSGIKVNRAYTPKNMMATELKAMLKVKK